MPSILEELLPKAMEQTKRFGRYCLNQYRLWYARQEEKRRKAEYQRWIEQVKGQISEKVYYIFKGDSELYTFEEVPNYEQQETIVNGQKQLQTVQVGMKKMPFVKYWFYEEPYCDVFSVRIVGKFTEEQKEILTDFFKTFGGPREKWVWIQDCQDGKYIRLCMANSIEDRHLITARMQRNII